MYLRRYLRYDVFKTLSECAVVKTLSEVWCVYDVI